MAEHPSFQFLPPGEPVEGKSYRANGWKYKDFPRLTYEAWDLLAIVGDGNHVLLSFADNGDSKRGQMLISSAGQQNLLARASRH